MRGRGGWDRRWSGGQVWGGKASPQGPEQRASRGRGPAGPGRRIGAGVSEPGTMSSLAISNQSIPFSNKSKKNQHQLNS